MEFLSIWLVKRLFVRTLWTCFFPPKHCYKRHINTYLLTYVSIYTREMHISYLRVEKTVFSYLFVFPDLLLPSSFAISCNEFSIRSKRYLSHAAVVCLPYYPFTHVTSFSCHPLFYHDVDHRFQLIFGDSTLKHQPSTLSAIIR